MNQFTERFFPYPYVLGWERAVGSYFLPSKKEEKIVSQPLHPLPWGYRDATANKRCARNRENRYHDPIAFVASRIRKSFLTF